MNCYHVIKKCRLCGESEFETLLDLGSQWLGSRFPKLMEKIPLSPLTLIKCLNSDCQLIQLSADVDGNELYLQGYGYRSGLNNSMKNHLEYLVRDIEFKIDIEDNDIILDIGSNDATTLKFYKKGNKIGIDPTGNQFKSFYPNEIRLVPDFFTLKNYPYEEKAKVITTISMFYDLPDIITFVSDLVQVLHPEGIWVSEQSYCKTMIEKNSFDTICHEHLEYYTIKQFIYLANKFGLKIVDITLNDCNGGSFRITLAHQNNDKIKIQQERINILILEEEREFTKEAFKNFVERIKLERRKLVDFVRYELAKEKKFCLYGASTKGNTLLQYYGLNSSMIYYAAERNPEKYGRVTPGTNIKIESEEFVRNFRPDYMIVLPWHFRNEFISRERNYLESGGKLIFPLPNFEVIDKDYLERGTKKALVIGCDGQIGSYLVDILKEKGYIVFGMNRERKEISIVSNKRINYIDDLENSNLGDEVEIYNMAAQTNSKISFDKIEETFEDNLNLVIKLCQHIRKYPKCKLFQANSSEIIKDNSRNLFSKNEGDLFRLSPVNPYGVSKAAAYQLIKLYRKEFNLFMVSGIIFNSESKRRKEGFLSSKIVNAVKNGTVLELGNIQSERDWIHAYDTAMAAWFSLQYSIPQDYIISLNKLNTVKKFIEICYQVKLNKTIKWESERGLIDDKVVVTYNKDLFKEDYPFAGENDRLKSIGWKPKYKDLTEIITDLFE